MNHQALLRDGTPVTVRRLEPADQEALERFAADLSFESWRLRFHGATRTSGEALTGGVGGRPTVAVVSGKIAAVATYVPLMDPDRAEMAVAVADAAQGLGLGTVLFEALADAARREGIHRLVAIVLPENRGMLRLLEDLGFRLDRHAEHGELEVTVDIRESRHHSDAADRRAHLAATASLHALMRPSSVAVIGASRRAGAVGNVVLRKILAGGFTGAVYPVNPNATTVHDVPAFPSAAAIGAPIDLGVVCLPAAQVPEAARDCLDAGARALVVISAGFAEAGPAGRALQDELVADCRAHAARLVGPNCLGVMLNSEALRLDATFAGAQPNPGGVALISQSGAIGIALLDEAKARGLGVSAFISLGNRADLSTNDLLEWFEDDATTHTIALYTETFGNPRRFARIARRVAAKRPIVALKSGRSRVGQRAAASHTAALAASDRVVDALFRQTGVVRCDTLEEFLDCVRVLDACGVPAGGQVAIVTNAGGLGILCADACITAGLAVPMLGQETTTRLAALLPAEASVANPVDVVAGTSAQTYGAALLAAHDDPAVDVVFALFVPPVVTRPDEVAAAIRAVRESRPAGKPIVASFVTPQGEPDALNPPGTRSIPCFAYPESAARALGHAARVAAFRRRRRGDLPALGLDTARVQVIIESALGDHDDTWLLPAEVLGVLDASGIPTPAWRVAHTADDAARAAVAIGMPVAVKLCSRTLIHKSDVGGVVLDAADEASVRDAYASVTAHADAGADGVLVQAMARGGLECLVGASTEPVFGPVVAFGIGGVTTELVGDVAFRLPPLTDTDAQEMLDEIRSAPLLRGFRGTAAVDQAALRDVVLRVAQLVDDVAMIAEADLNPVVAYARGVTAIDARVRVRRDA